MTAHPSVERPTNELKFETANPLVRAMIGGFFSRLGELVAPLRPASTLDAGCGEGETLVRLGPLLGERIAAVDLSAYSVGRVAERLPAVDAQVASVTALPFARLELRSRPLSRGARAPRRPRRRGSASSPASRLPTSWFPSPSSPGSGSAACSAASTCAPLGNHPEHVNHFNRRSLAALLEPALDIVAIRSPSRGLSRTAGRAEDQVDRGARPAGQARAGDRCAAADQRRTPGIRVAVGADRDDRPTSRLERAERDPGRIREAADGDVDRRVACRLERREACGQRDASAGFDPIASLIGERILIDHLDGGAAGRDQRRVRTGARAGGSALTSATVIAGEP